MNLVKITSKFSPQNGNTRSHRLWGRAIRATVSIFLPFIVGLMMNDIMIGMWIGMGCLMMITGETVGTYGDIYRSMFLSAFIGALGYLAGYFAILPWGIVVGLMTCLGAIAQYISSISHVLSIGTLQFLLLASIALGVPSIDNFAVPYGLYLVGTLLYALILGIEALLYRFTPLLYSSVLYHKAIQRGVKNENMANLEAIPHLKRAQVYALALCLGIAYSVHWIDNNPHWFWIPLTVGLIMKPDLGPINNRAFQRVIGTLLGVIIGAFMLIILPKNVVFILCMATLAGLLPWAMSRSYILQAVFLTPLILLLVNIILPGSADIDYARQRLLDTVIGSLIVIVFGYLPLNIYKSILLKKSVV